MPQLFSRLKIENSSYVLMPNNKKVVLILDSTPVLAVYCSKQQVLTEGCGEDKSFLVGTVGDIKDWLEEKEKRIRSTFDLVLSVISIILGLLLEGKPS